MKKYRKEITLGVLLVITLAILFVVIPAEEIKVSLKTILISVPISVILVFYLTNEIRKRREIRANIPVEDEMTKNQKVKAGNKAFHSSMLLWLLIFIFNRIFDKNETMLGIGILGSALIYGIYLWQYKLKGTSDE